jgi:RNA recognition motif-containing protein
MKNIYVGNLDFRTEEKEIRSLLEIYGVVERVTLVRDRDTGQPRGFAFVEMRNDTGPERHRRHRWHDGKRAHAERKRSTAKARARGERRARRQTRRRKVVACASCFGRKVEPTSASF